MSADEKEICCYTGFGPTSTGVNRELVNSIEVHMLHEKVISDAASTSSPYKYAFTVTYKDGTMYKSYVETPNYRIEFF